MTFQEFAQRLYMAIGQDESISAFTKTLLISALPDNSSILDDISNSSFKAYYYGRARISRLARKIYLDIRPILFERFLYEQNQAERLYCAFADVIPNISQKNACEYIANTFHHVLHEAIAPTDYAIPRLRCSQSKKYSTGGGGGGGNTLTVKEVAHYLRVTPRVISTYINQKNMPYTQCGKQYLFDINEVDAWKRDMTEALKRK